jgi:hypothetical protein
MMAFKFSLIVETVRAVAVGSSEVLGQTLVDISTSRRNATGIK